MQLLHWGSQNLLSRDVLNIEQPKDKTSQCNTSFTSPAPENQIRSHSRSTHSRDARRPVERITAWRRWMNGCSCGSGRHAKTCSGWEVEVKSSDPSCWRSEFRGGTGEFNNADSRCSPCDCWFQGPEVCGKVLMNINEVLPDGDAMWLNGRIAVEKKNTISHVR